MFRGYPSVRRERFDLMLLCVCACALPLFSVVIAGCSTGAGDGSTRGLVRAERFVERRSDEKESASASGSPGDPSRVIAQIDGRSIRHGEVHRRMIERSAGEILEELALERRLESRIEEAGISIDESDLARERGLMRRVMLSAGVSQGSEEADRLLRRIRAQRGLGEARYAALIRRNAMLRALVGETAAPEEEEIRRAYAAGFGARRVARLVTVSTLEEATRVARLAREGRDFAELASRFSTDVSAARGGLLEPMSLHDERYPRPVRTALGALGVGEVSGAIALGSRYAVIKHMRTVPGDADAPTFDSVRAELASEVRARRERILMSELASRLRPGVGEIDVFEPLMGRAWQRRAEIID